VTDSGRILGTFSGISANLFELADGAVEGAYIWNKINPTATDAKWQAFVEAYKADNDGQVPSNNTAANFYEAVYAVKDAIETLEITGDPAKAKEERDAIANYLYNSPSYNFLQGEFQYVKGERVQDPFFFRIENDDYVLVK
jgi:branched-chain amino acid transport system substrate-binding protein